MAVSCLSTHTHTECQHFLTQLIGDNYLGCQFTTFSKSWTKDELEGEVIDILLRSLRNEKCPIVLLAPLTSLCRSRFLELDLTGCKLAESDDYDAAAVCNALSEVFKTVCAEAEKNMSILMLKEIQQQSHVSVHSIRNARRKMEDQHTCYEDINTLFGFNDVEHGQSMFAVFDGHGGTEAAYYAASQLICELKSCPILLSNPGDALKHAVVQVDSKFVAKAGIEKIKSGCTAVVVLIQGENLTVAWVGDSQVVLCKNGQAIQLMEPHKPERADEKARIEALGGLVLYMNGWRVNGSLAVSRSIGDIDHKPYVTGEPDYEEYEMEGDEEFLILACDGLWDMVEPLDAVECVQMCIKNGIRDEASQKLVQLAKDNNSLDNITVMIVYLDFNKSNESDAT